MGYKESFSGLGPAELLGFVKSEARDALGGEGNAWIRLVDVAAAGMRRSPRAEDRALYAEAAFGALDGMRASSAVPDGRWAVMAVKVRVDRTLLSDRSGPERNLDASAAYDIVLGQTNAVGSHAPDIRRMASQLARVQEYLTAEQRRTVRAWADPDPGIQA
ncbi:hypothetical protein [Streptomyces sp. NPDC050548]|uniref:hypothetical protein n=1 Tax=Streptomyces sp. NPDC050548 TaxID=3365629 RepID=UPI003794ECC0